MVIELIRKYAISNERIISESFKELLEKYTRGNITIDAKIIEIDEEVENEFKDLISLELSNYTSTSTPSTLMQSEVT
ncbi:hypothetical protein BIY23_01040 [Wolbachia pipientis]|uniref:Uncharacterized protein n=1 Tax=Wolbachia pipientis TaxID=955 RepID=A0A1E7QKQ5_WOLPI|nr:hypothetical protein [Wolbachia pipientis]OEY87058.1 hypothetical protein BIY23_01040 [Wolbachia pipientis]